MVSTFLTAPEGSSRVSTSCEPQGLWVNHGVSCIRFAERQLWQRRLFERRAAGHTSHVTPRPPRFDAADRQPRCMPGVRQPRGVQARGLRLIERPELQQAAGAAPAVGGGVCCSCAPFLGSSVAETVQAEVRVRGPETQTALLPARSWQAGGELRLSARYLSGWHPRPDHMDSV